MWHKTTGDMLMHAARGDIAKTGAGERSRTLDLLITSQLLYQLSYTGEEGELCPRCCRHASRHQGNRMNGYQPKFAEQLMTIFMK